MIKTLYHIHIKTLTHDENVYLYGNIKEANDVTYTDFRCSSKMHYKKIKSIKSNNKQNRWHNYVARTNRRTMDDRNMNDFSSPLQTTAKAAGKIC